MTRVPIRAVTAILMHLNSPFGCPCPGMVNTYLVSSYAYQIPLGPPIHEWTEPSSPSSTHSSDHPSPTRKPRSKKRPAYSPYTKKQKKL